MELRSRSWCAAPSLASVGVAAILALMPGCGRTPTRIALTHDTLTINTRYPNAAGAYALTQGGDTTSAGTLAYRAIPDSILSVSKNGLVTCRRSGDGALFISAGAASARMSVQCRLIARMQMGFELGMPLGDSGRAVDLDAYDELKRPMGSVRVGITVRDTNIVRLEHGVLRPVSFGRTFVDADAGGEVRSRISVSVYEPVLQARPVAMAPGSITSWRLKPGVYALDLRMASPDSAARVAVSWKGTYCKDVQPPLASHLICLVRPEAQSPTLTIGANVSPVTGTVSLSRSFPP